MRKVLSLMLAMAFVVSLFSAQEAFAGKNRKSGTVKAIDEAGSTATFMFEGDKDTVTLAVDMDDFKTIKVGDNVRVDFDDSACTIIGRVKKEREVKIPVGC